MKCVVPWGQAGSACCHQLEGWILVLAEVVNKVWCSSTRIGDLSPDVETRIKIGCGKKACAIRRRNWVSQEVVVVERHREYGLAAEGEVRDSVLASRDLIET